jgi:DNA-binding NarL/FixJ family response regulator
LEINDLSTIKITKAKAVPDLLRAGLTVTVISKELGISKKAVYNVKKAGTHQKC